MRYFIVLIAIPFSTHAAAPGPVVISELMWAGSSSSSADEWIELFNRSDTTIDLSGWTLTRLGNNEDQVMLVFNAGSIASGQTFLIANYAADHKKSKLAVQPQYVDTAVSLPNTKLLLRLYDNDPQKGGEIMDVADDGRGTPFAGITAPKRSMVRIAFDKPGDEQSSWATAQEQSGWDAGSNELGTPGSIPAYLLPEKEDTDQTGIDTLIEPTTWAILKESAIE